MIPFLSDGGDATVREVSTAGRATLGLHEKIAMVLRLDSLFGINSAQGVVGVNRKRKRSTNPKLVG